MNHHFPEQTTHASSSDSRRQCDGFDYLVLSELNPLVVVDHVDGEHSTLTLLTFGNVREICPKCQQGKLKLVLRQTSVRVAHLFCAECESCFDARYADGAPALTI
ncbi:MULTISPECIES: hypothetical protein [unclassified Massilia]|uniref:hypothetical protein n=1 Tax=unclassified Massilia TaxID=2609279 RepID=UPI00160298F3|nr:MULTISPECIES: hypothetical protein [unclassified Massilia]